MLLPDKKYDIIYADPPWTHRLSGSTTNSRGLAKSHYQLMSVEDICALPVRDIAADTSILFLWATFPTISDAIKVMESWGFIYKTAAFVWVKKNRKSDTNFWGMGAYTRANAEVCLLGVSKGTRAKQQVIANNVHQIVEAPIGAHSAKPSEVRDRIASLLGDVPRIELFARDRVAGWDAWGNEIEVGD